MKVKWLVAFVTLVLILGCKKESDSDKIPDPDKMIVGKWIIESMELLANDIPGDGSYLDFQECTATCNGVDYKASDTTTGSFTYVLNESATILEIVDTTSNGGSYNGNWDILELSDSKFRIVGNTFLGSLKLNMAK